MPVSAKTKNAIAIALGDSNTASEIVAILNSPDYDAAGVIFTGTGDATMASGQKAIIVKKNTGAATAVTLPSTPSAWQEAVVVDGKGDAATNNITISSGDASGTINGTSSLVINTNYGAARLQYDGSEWINIGGSSTVAATVPTTKLAQSTNSYIKTDSGVKDLLAAAAATRTVMIAVTVTTAFADGDGTQPTLSIGEESGSASKFAPTTVFTGASASTVCKVFSGTLTSGKKLQATLVAGTGTTETGAYTIDVIAVG